MTQHIYVCICSVRVHKRMYLYAVRASDFGGVFQIICDYSPAVPPTLAELHETSEIMIEFTIQFF